MKKLVTMIMTAFLIPTFCFGYTVDYAHIDYGASIYDYSSNLNDLQVIFDADPRDVIGGSFSLYHTGESGKFIFGEGDMDQYIIVDLGAVRSIDTVGALFGLESCPPGQTGCWNYEDREVWDYFGVSVAIDPSSFYLVGSIGDKDDGRRDVESFSEYFTLSQSVDARYLMYEFGQNSFDYGGGSRVTKVYAYGQPVPEPSSILLISSGILGFGGIRKKYLKK